LIGTAAAGDADQEMAIAAIERVKGNVSGNPPDIVTLTNRENANSAMLYVDKLTTVTGIYANNTDVNNDGIAKVKGLTKLMHLSLKKTKITDKGLESLKGLTKL